MRILLIEPDYKNKYPPLGLMKISTFHKRKNHEVVFYKGFSERLSSQKWDRIYISTLYTFYWKKTIDTIKYYSKSVKKVSDIYVGGVMATLLKGDIQKETRVTVIKGLLNKRGKLGYGDDGNIDNILPDYSIIDPTRNALLDYNYPVSDSYLAYATRGCIRKCKFCAVHVIEPCFTNSLSIAKQVESIKNNFGEKKNLLLLDNNVLASSDFEKIINEIKSIGFGKDAKYIRKAKSKSLSLNRFIDFNQGVDARLLTKEKMKLLSEIAINPLRIAFDDIKYKDIYVEKVRWAAEFKINNLSNYILYNFINDTPDDFYRRLRINVELNEEFKKNNCQSKIWSFPMKYSPVLGRQCKNRKYIGKHWNKKYLRAIQCILIATHGVVGPGKKFFQKAFGKDIDEFKKILIMPEDYIIYRKKHERNHQTQDWHRRINSLSKKEFKAFWNLIKNNKFKKVSYSSLSKKLQAVMKHYE